jgi:hypothetical protein
VVVIVYIHRFDWFCWSQGSRTLGGSSVNDISWYCRGGCTGTIPYQLPKKAAISFIIDACDQVPLILWQKQEQQCLTLWWRSFSRSDRKHLAISIVYKGSQYNVSNYLQPVAHKITQHTQPTIIHAPLTLIFRLRLGAWLSSFWSPLQTIHPTQSGMYQYEHFAFNSGMSECDYK